MEYQNKMSIYDIIVCNGELIEVRQRDKGNPLTTKDDKVARAFIEKYWSNIIEKWINFFVYKKRVRAQT